MSRKLTSIQILAPIPRARPQRARSYPSSLTRMLSRRRIILHPPRHGFLIGTTSRREHIVERSLRFVEGLSMRRDTDFRLHPSSAASRIRKARRQPVDARRALQKGTDWRGGRQIPMDTTVKLPSCMGAFNTLETLVLAPPRYLQLAL